MVQFELEIDTMRSQIQLSDCKVVHWEKKIDDKIVDIFYIRNHEKFGTVLIEGYDCLINNLGGGWGSCYLRISEIMGSITHVPVTNRDCRDFHQFVAEWLDFREREAALKSAKF